MPNINVDMKSTADFAVKSARERFSQELDYSDQSITRLENITTQIYWGFSNREKNARQDGLVYNTAVIWGSYLGEFMRLKWGGTWVLKGSDPLISVNNLEFSPITLIYQKITDHPEYNLENYILEASKRITPVVVAAQKVAPVAVIAQKASPPATTSNQPLVPVPIIETEQPRKLDKRLIIALAGFGGLFLVTLVCIIGYSMVKAGTLSMFGLFGANSSPTADGGLGTPGGTPTTSFTDTPYYTPTLLPTYTPRPSSTPLPTQSPTATFTELPSLTPTAIPPTVTLTRTPRPTRTPTSTHIPATEAPPATPTNPPPPPPTEPPPPVISSCEISPSTVPAVSNTPITFIAHFSAPGYGFNAEIQGNFPGQSACGGTDTNGDGTAECNGSSGLLPSSTKVDVKFSSPIGDCTASYSSQ